MGPWGGSEAGGSEAMQRGCKQGGQGTAKPFALKARCESGHIYIHVNHVGTMVGIHRSKEQRIERDIDLYLWRGGVVIKR